MPAGAPWPTPHSVQLGSAGAALGGLSGGGAPCGPFRAPPPPPPPPPRPPAQRSHTPFWELQQAQEVEAWHIATPADDMLLDGEMLTEAEMQEFGLL